MLQPCFYLLAGPNGAGKSSLYKAAVLAGLIPAAAEFVNADVYERDHLQHITDPQARSEAARAWADSRRAALLLAGHSFVSETVFSHPSKLTLITQAQAKGFVVVLLVVCMDNPKALLARVQQRVSEGGHDVPAERILARYPRTLEHLRQAVRSADLALLYDNPGAAGAQQIEPTQVARCRRGRPDAIVSQPLPRWAQQVLGILQN